jgi:hypothetical protein
MLNEGDRLGNKVNYPPIALSPHSEGEIARDTHFVRFVFAIADEFAPLRA